MSATKTEAFVLKTQDYRDTSLLATFYTRDFGKVRVIVKGIRDARYRYGSTLEPFSRNEILFYRRRRGSDLHQTTQADLVELYPAVREDLERIAQGSYFIELLDALTEVEEPEPRIFELLDDALRFLGSGASPRRAARIFEVKLFDIVGLLPETRRCVSCGAEAPDPAFFGISVGGIRCQPCHAKRRPDEQGNFPVSQGTLQFLSRAQRSEMKDLANVKVSKEVGEELERLMRRFVDFQLQAKLKSVVFLEKLGLY